MDMALFGASASLSLYLPRALFYTQSTVEQSSVAVALGLSFSLFSLSLLEAIPDSWLMLLAHEVVPQEEEDPLLVSTYTFTITRAYWIILWALCIFLIVALPCMAGVAGALGFGEFFETPQVDRDDHKYPIMHWRKCPWYVRFVALVCKLLVTRTVRLFGQCCRFCLLSRPKTEPILAMTVSEDELRTMGASNPNTERRGLVMSIHENFLSRYRNAILLGCICGVTSMLVVISSIGPLVVRVNAENSTLSMAVTWLCAIGLLLSSLLNGFGSVSMPYSCLVGLYLEPIRPEAIAKAEAELQSVIAAMESKRSKAREMAASISTRATRLRANPPNNKAGLSRLLPKLSSSFNKKVSTSFAEMGEDLTHKKQILQTEIEFLEILCKDMRADLDEMRHSQAMAAVARTKMGRIQSWLGVVFSFILLIRLMSAGVNIWHTDVPLGPRLLKAPRGDFITTALLWLTGHHFVSQEDFTTVSQVVSLSLTAFLGFSQVRTFLRTLAAVNRRLDRFYKKCFCAKSQITPRAEDSLSSMSEEPSFALGKSGGGMYYHVIASLTGCYFLSCIVITKMMLPEKYSSGFSSALGGMDLFTVNQRVVNIAYAFSAAVTAAILGMLFGIQRQNTLRNSTPLALKNEKIFNSSDAV
jgi:hypothetical protein